MNKNFIWVGFFLLLLFSFVSAEECNNNDVCELGEVSTCGDCNFATGWSCNHNDVCEAGEPNRECDDCPVEDEGLQESEIGNEGLQESEIGNEELQEEGITIREKCMGEVTSKLGSSQVMFKVVFKSVTV